MERTTSDVANLPKEVDYFKFAKYMKCMYDSDYPVKRSYMDLKILENEQSWQEIFVYRT